MHIMHPLGLDLCGRLKCYLVLTLLVVPFIWSFLSYWCFGKLFPQDRPQWLMPLPINAVKSGDIVHEGCSGGLNEFPKKISALNYLRTLSTGKDQSLKEREKIGPLFIQLDVWIRLVGLEPRQKSLHQNFVGPSNWILNGNLILSNFALCCIKRKKFRCCRWGAERRVKHAQTWSEDHHHSF